MSKKSEHIQCRLHEDVEYESEAIAYYRQQLTDGFTPRQIIVDALLRSANFTPEMFPQDKGRVTYGRIESMLADFAHEIIRSLKGSSLRTVSDSESDNESLDNEDRQFAQNIAAGYMARRNKRGKQ